MGFVFMSYSHADQGFVDLLTQALSDHGIATWVDRFQLMPGANWMQEVQQALANADVILFIISPNSATSSWVRDEINAAIQHTNTGNGKLVIPILIGAPSNVPASLSNIQWIDFSKDFDAALQLLLQVLPASVRQSSPSQAPTRKAKGYFFLSFVEEDSGFVADLRRFMEEQGYGHWDFQEGERDYGLQFWREIEDRIDRSAALLAILSADWPLSKWTPREFLYAEENQIPTFLLMARPMRASLLTVGLTHIDFTKDQEKGFSKLAQGISKLEQELKRKMRQDSM